MKLSDGNNTNKNDTGSKEEEILKIEVIGNRVEECVQRHVLQEASFSSTSSKRSIYRVPEPLRSVNSKAYTPQVISIGPLHHCNKNIMAMAQKCSYLQNFVDLTKLSYQKIAEQVMSCEQRVRDCYAETINMKSGEFVELLILDACFVVMYLISCMYPELLDRETFSLGRFELSGIFCDLLLLENQLPFFLLQQLFELLCFSSDCEPLLQSSSFIELARNYFIHEGMGCFRKNVSEDVYEVNHFVDLLRIHFVHPCKEIYNPSCRFIKASFQHSFWPPTAAELHDCGVSFKKKKFYYSREKCSLQISFQDHCSVIKMPQFIVDYSFEISMRNLIAYEQCSHSILESEDVSNYAMFMHFLINTNNDVSLLIDHGIIQNNLGSRKEITRLFNNLCKHVKVGRNLYNDESKRMKERCRRRRPRWMTSLRRNYFNTPWAIVSFIAAVLLLSLTLLQAVVAVVTLYK